MRNTNDDAQIDALGVLLERERARASERERKGGGCLLGSDRKQKLERAAVAAPV